MHLYRGRAYIHIAYRSLLHSFMVLGFKELSPVNKEGYLPMLKRSTRAMDA
jgi:hypothetical protein